jgi:purine-cytosine permease-like protein
MPGRESRRDVSDYRRFTRKISRENAVSWAWLLGTWTSAHFLNFVGQFDYFVLGTDERSPYVFGTAGVINISDAGYTPTFSIAGIFGQR